MTEFDTILCDLKLNRTSAIDAMRKGGWTIDQAAELAALQGAIAAVEAVIADGPVRDEYRPEKFGRMQFDANGWPVT
jgi:hypothetical protein